MTRFKLIQTLHQMPSRGLDLRSDSPTVQNDAGDYLERAAPYLRVRAPCTMSRVLNEEQADYEFDGKAPFSSPSARCRKPEVDSRPR
jgi:hypothetical protein